MSMSYNVCYVLTDGVHDRKVGYAVYDMLKGKYFTPKGGWSSSVSRADLLPEFVIKDVFSEPRYRVQPVFESDNNVCARRGYFYA